MYVHVIIRYYEELGHKTFESNNNYTATVDQENFVTDKFCMHAWLLHEI